MGLKCAEFARGTLSAGIAAGAVSLSLSSGGSLFSTLGAGDYMYLRLCDKALSRWEIVKCEAHAAASNNFTTLTRVYGGLSSTGAAQAWDAGDLVGQVFPGKAVEEILAQIAALVAALAGKSDTSHTHDGRYYTESEMDTALAGKLGTTAKAADSDKLDGMQPATTATASSVAQRDASGNLYASTFIGTVRYA